MSEQATTNVERIATPCDKLIFSGLYSITHHPTGRVWFGLTINLFARWRYDLSSLTKGNHPDADLQALWTDGETKEFSFQFKKRVPTFQIGTTYAIENTAYEQFRAKTLGERETLFTDAYDALTMACDDELYAAEGLVSFIHETEAFKGATVDPNEFVPFAHICGIYGIANKKLRKNYVGKSVDISDRWRKHTRDMHVGEHANYKFNAAYKATDLTRFAFTVLEITEACRLDNREAAWVKVAKSKKGWETMNIAAVG